MNGLKCNQVEAVGATPMALQMIGTNVVVPIGRQTRYTFFLVLIKEVSLQCGFTQPIGVQELP